MEQVKDVLSRRKQFQESRTQQSSEPTDAKEYYTRRAEILNSLEGHLTGYDCPECKNRGFINIVIENDVYKGQYEIRTRECGCMPARRELERIKASGLERLARTRTFRTFAADEGWQKQLKSLCKQYAKDKPSSWLYISGQPGSGKTHLCTAVSIELLKKGDTVRYMVWIDEAPRLKAYVKDPCFESFIAPFKKVKVLYIDDFLKTKDVSSITKADIDLAIRIINFRYNAGLCTIISSEFSMNDIIGIDEGLGTRIAEMCADKYNIYIAPDTQKNYRYRKGSDI